MGGNAMMPKWERIQGSSAGIALHAGSSPSDKSKGQS